MAAYTTQGQAATFMTGDEALPGRTSADAALNLGSEGYKPEDPNSGRDKDPKDGLYGKLGLDSPQGLYNKKKNKKAPKAPSYADIIAADKAASAFWEGASRDLYQWAQQQDEFGQQLLGNVLGMQQDVMEGLYQDAQEDRARYEGTYLPAVDDLVGRFNAYDTPERRDAEAARVMADAAANYEAQRQNSLSALEGFGIDPSQTRFAALDQTFRTQQAAASAGLANQARREVEDRGLELRAAGVDLLGRKSELQDTAREGFGMSSNIGQQMVGERNSTVDSSRGAFGVPAGFASIAAGSRMDAATVQNMGYQNKLAEAGIKAQQAAGAASATGTVLGAIGGYFGGPAGATAGQAAGAELQKSGSGAEAGGMVPGDLSPLPGRTDKHHVMLADGEFVVPAKVVRMKGREFFDRLVAKYDPSNPRLEAMEA